ncbi:hypothetical protein [Shewanella aestuarii]|uniref:DsbC family protein n=1 Tax=Shewanella aestuarii TaxID=1028752 RepID=A0A6G9QRL3_9GAMM|nr:hypothetical protein [Shewanella aestuarii]QIR16449.1 hypothetical protein HBH39_18430 [Shewanella aestuarii]
MKVTLTQLAISISILLASTSISAKAIDLEEAAKTKQSESNVEKGFSSEIQRMMSELGDIEVVRMMPIKQVMLIQLKDKPPMFISSNGRFLIDGTIKDLWNLTDVKTAKQADDTWLLDLDNFGDGSLMSQFAVIPYGNPAIPKQARIFVSPTAPESQAFVKSLDVSKVNIDLVIFPHEKGAITPSMKAWCGYSTLDSIQALITGETENIDQRDCDESDLKRVMTPMLMATYLDIDKVPYFVRTDGRRSSGIPKEPMSWLENKPKDKKSTDKTKTTSINTSGNGAQSK